MVPQALLKLSCKETASSIIKESVKCKLRRVGTGGKNVRRGVQKWKHMPEVEEELESHMSTRSLKSRKNR